MGTVERSVCSEDAPGPYLAGHGGGVCQGRGAPGSQVRGLLDKALGSERALWTCVVQLPPF